MNFFSPLGNRGHHFSAPLKTSVSEINGIAITKVNYQPNYYILVQNLIHVVDTIIYICFCNYFVLYRVTIALQLYSFTARKVYNSAELKLKY